MKKSVLVMVLVLLSVMIPLRGLAVETGGENASKVCTAQATQNKINAVNALKDAKPLGSSASSASQTPQKRQ